jgi:hypothetical protein
MTKENNGGSADGQRLDGFLGRLFSPSIPEQPNKVFRKSPMPTTKAAKVRMMGKNRATGTLRHGTGDKAF